MTTGDAPRRRENAFTLVKRLVSGGVTLAKLEVQRGRQEMARNLGQLKGGVLQSRDRGGAGRRLPHRRSLAFIMAVLVAIGLWWVALILLVVLLDRRRPAGLDAASGGSRARSSPPKRRSQRSRRTWSGRRTAC